jgi:putative transposase
MRPARKRKLVNAVRGEWNVSIRRTCRVLLFDASSYYVSLRCEGRVGNSDQGDLPERVC